MNPKSSRIKTAVSVRIVALMFSPSWCRATQFCRAEKLSGACLTVLGLIAGIQLVSAQRLRGLALLFCRRMSYSRRIGAWCCWFGLFEEAIQNGQITIQAG